MDVTLHLASPLQKQPQFATLPPDEFPELQKADLGHLHASVGFNTPQQIGTPPRGQAMALGGVPQEAELVAHAAMITTKDRNGTITEVVLAFVIWSEVWSQRSECQALSMLESSLCLEISSNA